MPGTAPASDKDEGSVQSAVQAVLTAEPRPATLTLTELEQAYLLTGVRAGLSRESYSEKHCGHTIANPDFVEQTCLLNPASKNPAGRFPGEIGS
jgi:hypothetical protein